jgi:diguanylate cyclase (GGDEF)-like protein
VGVQQDQQPYELEIMDGGVDVDILPMVPSGWSDPLTGTDGPRFWDRIVSSEVARVNRYRRPATVALLEIAGLDAYARKWGIDVAERLFVQLARTIAVEVRSSDHIARIDRTRFAILLTETDEIAAINIVERVRAACEYQLGASDLVRIAIGWASPWPTADLRAAVATADARLQEELETLF